MILKSWELGRKKQDTTYDNSIRYFKFFDSMHGCYAESVVIARYQMFTQVYFHKIRRAFDYHLKNAMIKALDGGKLPGIEAIDSFLRLDDYVMWNQLQYHQDDRDSMSIINRNHIREIYSTTEAPSQEDESEL